MSKVAYDLDNSGGLMPLIRALIKPPDEDLNQSKPKKSQHPYYKRPGKGHNHDCCDSCQEGGDLICCDRCPASFHLGCHDPPLEEADIPLGQWLCLECRSAGEKPRPISPSTSHRSFESDKKSRSLRVNRSNSCVSSTSSSSRKNDKDRDSNDKDVPEVKEKNLIVLESVAVAKEAPVEEGDLTPMELLVKAAKVMNPRQFELPREMRVHCPFPGTEKDPANGNSKAATYTRDSSGCVPLPAKLCFNCRTSCRTAPLLQCDYCSLLFHQDCLDPPLTALPVGRWMCPNHVEQFIDWQLVNSISATERVALWEKLSGPVDEDAIRLEFIRKARRRHPPFRIRLPAAPQRGRVRVPPMVRYHYKFPPSLLPSRRETVRCQAVMKTSRNFAMGMDEEEGEAKQVICMNLHCPRYLAKNSVCDHHSDSEDAEDDREADAVEDLEAISGMDVEGDDKSKAPGCFSRGSDRTTPDVSPKRKRRDPDEKAHVNLGRSKRDNYPLEEADESEVMFGIADNDPNETREIMIKVDERLKRLDGRLVKLLAYERLEQIIDEGTSELVTDNIDRAELARYGFRHVSLPSQLLTPADMERISREAAGAVAPREEVLRLRSSIRLSTPQHQPPCGISPTAPVSSLSGVPIRATLCPVERPARKGLGDGLGRPVPMRLSRLSVGLGGCDVALHNYGSCRFVSDRHAVIFFDRVTNHFELLNYSEFGTCVNGQLYSCDFTERMKQEEDGGTGAEEKASALRAIAAKRQGRPHVNTNLSMTPARPQGVCLCPDGGNTKEPLVAGWEGSAVLQHGALLQFGCLMFVFAITDGPLALH